MQRFSTRQKGQRRAVWNAERISSSRPAICSPERPAWDVINIATVDQECGRRGLSLSLASTGIIDQPTGHRGLTTEVPTSAHLFSFQLF